MNRNSIAHGCSSSKDFGEHQRAKKLNKKQMTPSLIRKERIINDEA